MGLPVPGAPPLRRLFAWLLPCLAVSALVGILVADCGWLTVAASGGLAVGSTAVALTARRRPAVVATCAAAAVGALGAAGHAYHLALADRHAPRSTFDAAVDGTVRALRREREWLALELHDVVPVRFGETLLPSVPERLRLVESAATPEGIWLAGLWMAIASARGCG